jgi:dipeptidyl aminopeptidase/acylaminoacyl peptidase
VERFFASLSASRRVAAGQLAAVGESDARQLTWKTADGKWFRTDFVTGLAEPTPPPAADGAAVAVIRAADAEGLPPVTEQLALSGAICLTEFEFNLALRDLRTGLVRQLTTSGNSRQPWHVNAQATTLVPTPRIWSPTGDVVFSVQSDLRHVPDYPLLDYTTSPVSQRHVPMPSHVSGPPLLSAAFVDVATGTVRPTEVSSDPRTIVPMRWTADGTAFLAMLADAAGQIELVAIAAGCGSVRTITSESAPILLAYVGPLLSALQLAFEEPTTMGWLSDQDGDLRLYCLDLCTGSRAPLTPAGVQVTKAIGIGRSGEILLLARADPERPYDQHVCRTDPAGDFRVMSKKSGHHEAVLLPGGQGFVHLHSSPNEPPSATVRDWQGVRQGSLSLNDRPHDRSPSAPAREVVVTAADGATTLHGLLYLPRDFSEHGRYPLVQIVYGGPQTVVSDPRWADPWRGSSLWIGAADMARAMAQLGFIGLVLDARGTPGRGRTFQQGATERFGSLAVEDYVAAIKQLAERHAWLDVDRVGVLGLSFGGYMAARCGLLAPDLYKAVVAAAGPYEPELTQPFWFEALLGASFQEDPRRYREAGIVAHAQELIPGILLVHGTADLNVTLDHTLRLSDALTVAGKKHRLVLAQGASHTLAGARGDHALREALAFLRHHLSPPE